jgi:hypothetical protein
MRETLKSLDEDDSTQVLTVDGQSVRVNPVLGNPMCLRQRHHDIAMPGGNASAFQEIL